MLQGQIYVPFLNAKGSELRAISKLENASRISIFPIVALRPGSHKNFDDTVSMVKEHIGDFRFALELDRHRLGICKKDPAKGQFDALFDEQNGYSAYYNLVENWKSSIPVLRSTGGFHLEFDRQITHIQNLDRGLVVRIEKNYTQDLDFLLDAIPFGEIDTLFVVDSGWAKDILQAEAWAGQIIHNIFAKQTDGEIACISSSFPNDFRDVKSRGVFTNDDRELYERIRRRYNQAKLTYGDWASTRPSEERITNTPRPRIDIPTPREWISFRLGDRENGGFQSVATRATKDRVWLETPDCWGKRAIELTAMDLPGKIHSTHSANAARIQLHMTIQAMGGEITALPDIPYVDAF